MGDPFRLHPSFGMSRRENQAKVTDITLSTKFMQTALRFFACSTREEIGKTDFLRVRLDTAGIYCTVR